MPASVVYDIGVDVPAAEMYRFFAAADYWHDLIEFYRENSGQTDLLGFSSGAAGIDVSFAHVLNSQDFPTITRPFLAGSFTVTRVQHFDPFQPDTQQATGSYRADIPAPAEVHGDYLLSDVADGSQMRLTSTCRVKVPIVGRQIEQLMVGGLKQFFAREGDFTADWVARHS